MQAAEKAAKAEDDFKALLDELQPPITAKTAWPAVRRQVSTSIGHMRACFEQNLAFQCSSAASCLLVGVRHDRPALMQSPMQRPLGTLAAR